MESREEATKGKLAELERLHMTQLSFSIQLLRAIIIPLVDECDFVTITTKSFEIADYDKVVLPQSSSVECGQKESSKSWSIGKHFQDKMRQQLERITISKKPGFETKRSTASMME